MATLGAVGAGLHNADSRRRLAQQAALGLAVAGLAPDGWLERALISRIDQGTSANTGAGAVVVGYEVSV